MLFAQSTNATLSGVVVDTSGLVIMNADIVILNEATGVQYSSKTNGTGIYTITVLPPGQYRVQVSKPGFKTLIKPGIVLNVQSALALNFTLPVGATSESITVDGGTSLVDRKLSLRTRIFLRTTSIRLSALTATSPSTASVVTAMSSLPQLTSPNKSKARSSTPSRRWPMVTGFRSKQTISLLIPSNLSTCFNGGMNGSTVPRAVWSSLLHSPANPCPSYSAYRI